jgi:hypothetical protein
VAYLFQAGTVEPEKEPLLANGSETTFFFRQRSQETGNRGVTVGKACSTVVLAEGLQGGQLEQESDNWKGELDPGSREIAIVISHYQATTSEATTDWTGFSLCSSDL